MKSPHHHAALACSVLLFGITYPADAAYLTRQITSSSGKVEDHIRISGSRVVWQRKFSTDYEIYAYDGSSVLQLTNNGTDDTDPEISGDRVVYLDATDVICYDFSTGTTSNLSNDAGWQMDPRIDGDFVYWIEWDAVDLNRELIRYELSTGTRTNISDNALKNDHNSESNLTIHDNRAAWIAWNNSTSSSAILFNDGSYTVTLGDDVLKTYYKARVTEDHVLWLESSSSGVWLSVYDGNSISQVDVTTNPIEDIVIGPSGILVTRSMPGDTEGSSQLDLYSFDPNTLAFTAVAEDSSGHDQYPAVGDGIFAWTHDLAETGINDSYVQVLDIASGTTEEVSETLWVDQYTVASGRNVAWRGYDFDVSGQTEIFVAYWLGAGAVLTGVDLSGEDLTGLVFSGADLRGANLSGAILDGGALAGSIIDASTLFTDGADFTTTSDDLSGITLPSAFGDWMTELGLTGADASSDSDGDGQSNLLEFALGGDAADASKLAVIRSVLGDSDSDGSDEFQYLIAARRGAIFGAVGSGALGADIDGLSYRVEGAGNLSDYFEDLVFIDSSDTAPAETGLPDLVGSDWEYLRFRFSSPPSSGSGFMKVSITPEP
ncbi:MAG: pentapeptide repeat-containing protein [Luteolibacter sp.]